MENVQIYSHGVFPKLIVKSTSLSINQSKVKFSCESKCFAFLNCEIKSTYCNKLSGYSSENVPLFFHFSQRKVFAIHSQNLLPLIILNVEIGMYDVHMMHTSYLR